MNGSSKPTVLVLAYYYPPDNTSGVFRTLYFFNHIAQRGKWNICILTLDPDSFQPGQTRDQHLFQQIAPQIKVFTARALFPRETLIQIRDKIKGVAAATGTTNNQVFSPLFAHKRRISWWGRCKDIVTDEILAFPDNKVGWLPFAYKQAKKIIRKYQVDVIYSSASPWTSHILGYMLKKKFGLPLVLDYRDPWHGNPYEVENRSSIYKKAAFQLEKTVIAKAEKVVCNTNRLRLFYQQTFGWDDKFVTITNGYEQVAESIVSEGKNTRKFVIVHAGSLYGGRNPTNFFTAVMELNRQDNLPKIQVILVGAGEDLQQLIREQYGEAVLNTTFIVTPRVSHEKCLRYLLDADLLLLFQQGTRLQVPRKLYEYIGLRKPVLGICEEGETGDIIRNNRIGLAVCDEISAIKKALCTCITSKANGAPARLCKLFDNIVLARQLETVLSDAIEGVPS